jgi:hypothetical protein
VSEGDGLFGVAGDGKDPVVVFGVVAVAKVDHVFDRGDAIDPVFEDMMRLGFADAFAFGDTANTVTVGKGTVLVDSWRGVPWLLIRWVGHCARSAECRFVRRKVLLANEDDQPVDYSRN